MRRSGPGYGLTGFLVRGFGASEGGRGGGGGRNSEALPVLALAASSGAGGSGVGWCKLVAKWLFGSHRPQRELQNTLWTVSIL